MSIFMGDRVYESIFNRGIHDVGGVDAGALLESVDDRRARHPPQVCELKKAVRAPPHIAAIELFGRRMTTGGVIELIEPGDIFRQNERPFRRHHRGSATGDEKKDRPRKNRHLHAGWYGPVLATTDVIKGQRAKHGWAAAREG